MTSSIPYARLQSELTGDRSPLLIDVRRRAADLAASERIRGALRRDPDAVAAWAPQLPAAARVVVYCAHGRELSQSVAAELAHRGLDAAFLEGGIEGGWKPHGGALDAKSAGAPSRWVTRARPKIDRIACPWLIRRFVDPDAEILFAPPDQVLSVARAQGAVPFDVPDTVFSHDGGRCSFDAFLAHFRLHEPALRELATIVRGADTGELHLAPQAPGLLAVSLGLSRLCPDDHEMLRHGLVLYDALYLWCREGKDETHTWNPNAYRTVAV